jgi:hypothetical protein
MATWAVQRAGNFARTSDNADSPWHDGGAQTALASIPQVGDTITNAGAFTLSFDIDLPAVTSVLDSDTVYGAAGTYHAPEASEVIDTAVFGPSSSISGTFDEEARNVDPGEAAVQWGVAYKIHNVDKMGSNMLSGVVIERNVVTLQGNVERNVIVGQHT